ncbi:zinc finger, CCHC-type containing protein [Tanacetum coccineum]
MLRAYLFLRFFASSIGVTVNHVASNAINARRLPLAPLVYALMTTSVGNNSVFRSFFEKQKLTGPNFIDWYRQLRLVLSTEDKENYLEHPIPVAPVAQPGQQVPPEALAAHAAWVKGQKEVAVLMLLTMDLDIQRNLAHLGAYDMLQELKAMFSKQAEQELLQTVREFHTCKQEEGQSVSSHVLKMKGYIDNLERLGQPVGQNLAVSLILVSLNKDFASFVQNFNMHGMGKTVNELHAMLKLHEETLPKKDANPALHAIRAGRVQKNQKNKPHKAGKGGQGKGKNKMGYAHNNVPFAPKPKTPPPPKKDNPAKDAICHQCGEVGHWRRNCPVYLAELMKKKKLSQGASAKNVVSYLMEGASHFRVYGGNKKLKSWCFEFCKWAMIIVSCFMYGKMARMENLIRFKWKGHKRSIGTIPLRCLQKGVEITTQEDHKYRSDHESIRLEIAFVARASLKSYEVDYEEKPFLLFADLRAIRILIVELRIFINVASTPAEKQRMQNVPYASAIGSIMYAVRCHLVLMFAFATYLTSQFPILNPSNMKRASSACLATIVLDIEDATIRAIAIAKDDWSHIKIEKVDTDDNLADPFTKALAFPKNSELTRNIGMLSARCIETPLGCRIAYPKCLEIGKRQETGGNAEETSPGKVETFLQLCKNTFALSLGFRILGQPTSSSCCERNWSTYSFIHSLERNKLTPKRAEDLVLIHNNLRLLSRSTDQYNEEKTMMWDVGGDDFGTLEDTWFLEFASLSLDELELESVFFSENTTTN